MAKKDLSSLLAESSASSTFDSAAQYAQARHVNDVLNIESAAYQEIECDLIDASPYQPRREFDQDKLRELADSIRTTKGLIEPISVRVKPDERFELIAGERRLLAYKLLGETRIPAIVRNVSDKSAALMATAENMQRVDLTDFEAGMAISRLKDEVGATISDLSDALGKIRVEIYRYLAFADLCQISSVCFTLLSERPAAFGRNAAYEIAKFYRENESNEARQLIDKLVYKLADKQVPEKDARSWLTTAYQRTMEPDLVGKSNLIPDTRIRNASGKVVARYETKGAKLSLTITDTALREKIQGVIETELANYQSGKPME